MAKVIIEMIDDDDGMVFRMTGDPIPEGEASVAQLLGMSLAAALKAGIHDEVIQFVTGRIFRATRN